MKITFDTNCFFDYYERDSALVEEIINFQKGGYVEIAVTTRVRADTISKSKSEGTSLIWQKIQDFPLLDVIGTAFRIGMSQIDSQDYLISDEDSYILDKLRAIMVSAQVQDVDHLFGHIKAKRDIFVTSDRHFLDHQEQLRKELNAVVLNPNDAIEQLKRSLGSKISIDPNQLLSLLEGTWAGEGRGEYPTIQSFDYRETLTFRRRDENTLAYEQRTQKRFDGQTEFLLSHWENGFIRVLENRELEMVNAQSGGRTEILIGIAEPISNLIRIHFKSSAITNDPRVICTERVFELEGDTLRYEMGMQTIKVERLMPHLKITLRRIE